MKQEILDYLNAAIVDEKGNSITMDSMFMDSNLDSLGMMITLVTLDAKYPIFKDIPNEMDEIAYLDIPNLTVRELVRKCKLSITNTSMVLS